MGMMLEAYEEGNSNMTKSQLLDQCKTMLIASDNPTSLLMIWTYITNVLKLLIERFNIT